MQCRKPLHAVRAKATNAEGKRPVFLTGRLGEDSTHQDKHWEPIQLPCGQCTGCRLERSRQWAIRCVHEASLHQDNCFITLTYDDDKLPEGGTLRKAHFQRFMKRLRKAITPQKVRFYHCGEYGANFGRPHYHACLFGFDFKDKYLWTTRNNLPAYRSETLEKLWPSGISEIGDVTFESAAYVARYIMKKITGPGAQTHYAGRTPEYTTMSRRPGIGSNWLSHFRDETYPADTVVIRGRQMKPPRAYDIALELTDPDLMDRVRQQRRDKRRTEDHSLARRAAIDTVLEARLALNPRSKIQ